MPRFNIILLILCNNDKLYLSFSEETYFQAMILHILEPYPADSSLALTAASQPLLEFSLSPK